MESAQHREGNRQRVRTEGRWYYALPSVTRGQAEVLFSGRNGRCVTTTEVIHNIDQLLARPGIQEDSEVTRTARRQAVIDGLLAKANEVAHKARRVATAVVGALF